jgi:hypothetical protein
VPESRVSLSDGVAGWIKRCGKPARLDDPSTLPALTQHRNGEWRTAIDRNVPHRFTIPRGDLAACILSLIDDPSSIHRHVFVAK